jgi:hypothetical protein
MWPPEGARPGVLGADGPHAPQDGPHRRVLEGEGAGPPRPGAVHRELARPDAEHQVGPAAPRDQAHQHVPGSSSASARNGAAHSPAGKAAAA